MESEEPVFGTGDTLKVYWSPLGIFPQLDPNSYTVDIILREPDRDTREWNILTPLARDILNNGMAEITIPELPSVDSYDDTVNLVVLEVGISSASLAQSDPSSNVLTKVGQCGLRIVKQSPKRILKKPIRQCAQPFLACEMWARTQAEEHWTRDNQQSIAVSMYSRSRWSSKQWFQGRKTVVNC